MKLCKICKQPNNRRKSTCSYECELEQVRQAQQKKKEKAKKAKKNKKNLRKRVLELAKQIVHLRDNDICQKSGEKVFGRNCQCSHVIPVSADKRLQYEPENMKILSHHWHLNWWHKNPLESAEWFKEKFPERWKYLQDKKIENNGKGTIHLSELEEIENNLQNQLKSFNIDSNEK